jgi:hypothetical protein
MKRRVGLALAFLCFALVASGCVYRHYLGMHGPSIQQNPETHQGVRDDAQCLACHHPERNPVGPPTNHPQFKGCLKCHNS